MVPLVICFSFLASRSSEGDESVIFLTTTLQMPTTDLLLSSEQPVMLLHFGDCIGSLGVGM